jgi:hypothetical protein
MNREHIIVNSSTHIDPTLRFTPLVTQFLLVPQPDLTPEEAKLISSFIPSQVHGSSLPNLTVPPTVSTLQKNKKNASDLFPYPVELIAFQPLESIWPASSKNQQSPI